VESERIVNSQRIQGRLKYLVVTPGYASTEVEVKIFVESGSISLSTAE